MLETESEKSYEADSEDNETDDEERIIYQPRNILVPEPCEYCGEITCIGCYTPSYNSSSESAPSVATNDDESEIEFIIQNNEFQSFHTIPYDYTLQELQDIYAENIKIKQVIASQPIERGGSKCTWDCDTENHHIHTYCKACQRNLPYGTINHHCTIGFEQGQ